MPSPLRRASKSCSLAHHLTQWQRHRNPPESERLRHHHRHYHPRRPHRRSVVAARSRSRRRWRRCSPTPKGTSSPRSSFLPSVRPSVAVNRAWSPRTATKSTLTNNANTVGVAAALREEITNERTNERGGREEGRRPSSVLTLALRRKTDATSRRPPGTNGRRTETDGPAAIGQQKKATGRGRREGRNCRLCGRGGRIKKCFTRPSVRAAAASSFVFAVDVVLVGGLNCDRGPRGGRPGRPTRCTQQASGHWIRRRSRASCRCSRRRLPSPLFARFGLFYCFHGASQPQFVLPRRSSRAT